MEKAGQYKNLWQNHVLSNCEYIEHRIKQLCLLGSQGLSLTEAKGYPPLPYWQKLDSLAYSALSAIEKLGKEYQPICKHQERTQSDTEFVIRQLVNEILDDLDELKPERIESAYGPMSDADSDRIGYAVLEVIEQLTELQRRLKEHDV